MKCYVGGSQKPHDHEFVEACFARNAKEAKSIMWKCGNLSEECDGDYMGTRIIRKPEYDRLHDPKKDAPYIVADQQTLREMGWRMECDDICDSCGLSAFEGEYPVCEECGQCNECGCTQTCGCAI